MKTPPCAAHDADTEQELLRERLEAQEADREAQGYLRPERRNVGNYQSNIKSMKKKHELLKYAYDNYPRGTKITWGVTELIATGCYRMMASGKVYDSNDICIFDPEGDKWAEIIPEAPVSILTGKCAIQVNNEREFKLLMEHYEAKGWGSDACNEHQQYQHNDHFNCYDYHDNFRRSSEITQVDLGYTIIPFPDFAKEVGTTVPVFVMKSEDGVDLYVGDRFFIASKFTNWELVCPDPMELTSCTKSHSLTNKAFSTKEAAEKWIKEQNKPKKIIIPCTGGEVVVGKLTVTFNVAANREFSSTFFDKIVEAYQSLKS